MHAQVCCMGVGGIMVSVSKRLLFITHLCCTDVLHFDLAWYSASEPEWGFQKQKDVRRRDPAACPSCTSQ